MNVAKEEKSNFESQLSQTKKEPTQMRSCTTHPSADAQVDKHATFNLGYDQCHLCHHHQKQLFREKMMHYSTHNYFVLLFLRLMSALAYPVDHSSSHIHLFTKARMTKAPP